MKLSILIIDIGYFPASSAGVLRIGSSRLAIELLESSKNSSLKDAHSKDNERKEEGPLQHEDAVARFGHCGGDQTL